MANTAKPLPENPTNHEDSRNFKEIQGVVSTLGFLKFLESAWFVGFSGKSLQKETRGNFLNSHFPSDCQINPQHTDMCHTSPHPYTHLT